MSSLAMSIFLFLFATSLSKDIFLHIQHFWTMLVLCLLDSTMLFLHLPVKKRWEIMDLSQSELNGDWLKQNNHRQIHVQSITCTSEQEACIEKSLKQLMTQCWSSRPSASNVFTVESNNPGFVAQQMSIRVSVFLLSTSNCKTTQPKEERKMSAHCSIPVAHDNCRKLKIHQEKGEACSNRPWVNFWQGLRWALDLWRCPSIWVDCLFQPPFLPHLEGCWSCLGALSCNLWCLLGLKSCPSAKDRCPFISLHQPKGKGN